MTQQAVSFLKHYWATLTHCRLCRHVTGAAFLAIVLVEGAILFFSIQSFERDRLQEIEREGLAVVRAWFQISSDGGPEILNRMAPIIGNGSVLLSAEVEDTAGNELAYLKQNSILPPEKNAQFSVTWLPDQLGYPLVVKAQLDRSELPAQLNAFIWRIVGLVLLISVVVTFVMMAILNRLVLDPIRTLNGRMEAAEQDVSNPTNYRIMQYRNDELGDASQSYNRLLSRLSLAFKEIRIQQERLEENNQRLEYQVLDRTKELSDVVADLRREAAERERMEKAFEEGQGASQALEKLVYTDTLTGLSNRDLFFDRLGQTVRQVKRTGVKAAVHMIDIDGFSAINQAYGQQAGDRVLQTVAERLKVLLRDSDTVARLGADEFAVLQLDADTVDTASILAQRICQTIEAPVTWDGKPIDVFCSVGIAMADDSDHAADEIANHATLARQRAKEDKGATYRFYQESMDAQERERREIERDLKQAILDGSLQVYYQPKLNLKTNRLAGMEALVRWIHPERGFVSPALFIPIAERSSLVVQLGEQVLRQAALQAKKWNAAGLGPLKVAVNVSAVQLKEISMVTLVRQVLLETGLDPACLELEITESAVMDNVEDMIAGLSDLRDLGVSLSIDDFGTGYSSLNYLKRFPVKRIKVDKAFVDEIETMESEGVIARAVITMGHSFGMEITAEGVETAAQLQFLKAHDCDEVQGYHYGKPMTTADFEAFARAQSTTAFAAE